MNRALRLTLMLVLAASWVQPRQTQAQQPAPSTPSKEYIYLGGRLIATEEGTQLVTQGSPDLTPTIGTLSPNSALPGQTFTLTVTGTNLFSGSTISFSPAAHITVGQATSSMQNTQLTATVTLPPDTPQGPYLVVVNNGHGSNNFPFTISESQTGGPFNIVFDSGSANTEVAGTPNTLVKLAWTSGPQFNSSSAVWLNGNLYASGSQLFFRDPTHIQFVLQAADMALPRVLDITVQTNVSGAVLVSNTLSFPITNPVGSPNPFPVILADSLTPNSITIGQTQQTIQLSSIGDTFSQTSSLVVNGLVRGTAHVPTSGGLALQTTITASDTPHPGSLSIQVFTPHPGGCPLFSSDGIIICGLALNSLSLRILPPTPTTPNPLSIALSGSAWVKVPPGDPDASGTLNITGPLTVEAWVYPKSLTGKQAIVERYDATQGTNKGGYGLRLNSGGTVTFSTYRSNTDFDSVTTAGSVSAFGWNHVAGVFDGTTLSIYINGQLGASNNCGGIGCRAPKRDPNQPLLIGASSDASGNGGLFTGDLDEVRVSNSAVYTSNFSPPPGLSPGFSTAGLWKFDDQTLNDSSGNQHDGVGKGGSIQFSNNIFGFTGTESLIGETGGGNLPTLGSISQASANPGDSQFQLSVYGSRLSGGMTLYPPPSSSTPITVTPVSSTCQGTSCQVTANVTVSPLAEPGGYLISVGNSDTIIFQVNPIAPNSPPSVGATSGGTLIPNSLSIGSPAQNITLNGGSGFISGSSGTSRVHINGSPRFTTVNSSTSLTFTLLQEDLENAGPLTVTVYNPPSTYNGPNPPLNGGESGDSLIFNVTAPADNPSPNVNSISPTTVQNGTTVTPLKVFGTNFVSGAQIVYRGAPRADTQRISSTELDLNLSSADTANNTGQTLNVPVFVDNPPPGGGKSTTSQPLSITGPNPIPTITNLTVGGAAPHISAGGPQFTLQVTGTGFVGTTAQTVSYVNVNGQSRQTTTQFKSAIELDVTITPADISSPGQLEITVFSPTPGGGTSDPMLLTVQPAGNPLPQLNSITPPTSYQVDRTTAGNQTPVQLNGSGFMTGSRVLVNGFPRTTDPFISSDPTHLTVHLPDSDFAVLGQLQIEVSNPEPGGGTSSAKPLSVQAPAPTLSTISPSSAPAGSNSVTITLTGTNFIDESTVLVNNVSRAAAVVPGSGGTQLQTTLTSDVASGAILNIAVSNPTVGGGGGTTSTVPFTVNNPPPVLDLNTPLTPTAVMAASSTVQTVSVLGTGFVPTSQINIINGTNHAVYVDPTHLNLVLQPSDVVDGGSVTITVVNSTPGGGSSTSNTPLTINNPQPALDPVNPFTPPSLLVGSLTGTQTRTITVLGTGFVKSSQITVGGSNRTAGFQDASHLTFTLNAADVSSAANLPVTVTNPAPQGGSTSGTFPVQSPVPTVTGLDQPTITRNFITEIKVQGSNFVIGQTQQGSATVQIKGVDHPAILADSDANHLAISLTLNDVNSNGQFPVTVTNPAPNAGVSASTPLTVIDPPVLSGISPSSAIVRQTPEPTITVTGTGFIYPGSVVMFNSAAHIPNLNSSSCTNSATQLCITLTAEPDLSSPAGVYPITVVTPTPGGVSNPVNFTLNNPVPQGASLSPSAVTTNMSSPPLLTIVGSRFVIGATPQASSTVQIGTGSPHNVLFPQSTTTQLVVQLTAADVSAAGNYQVTVTNPPPGGGTQTIPGTFSVINPPQVSTISPNSATVGNGDTNAAVTGSNFIYPGSVVMLNGATHNTNANSQSCTNSATTLCITLRSDPDLNATAGVYPVTVVTPTLGGVSNNTVSFTLNNPQIGMGSLSSSSVLAGSGAQTLAVTGTGFVPATSVTINGQNRATYVSPTQLNVSILASETATAGTIPITAVNAAPGGGSGTLTFTINNPTPTISSLSPASATAGGAAFTLTVNGANFVSGATVQVNGSSRTTTFVSATQLTASIPAGDIASAGTLSITVVNPAPSAGASAAASFAVNSPSPDFSLSLSTSSLSIARGGSGSTTITVSSLNGFNSATSLTVTGVPSGVTASFSSTSVTPPPGGVATSKLTLTVPFTAATGTFTLTIKGTSGSISHTITLTLTIT